MDELNLSEFKGLFAPAINQTPSKVNPDYVFKDDGYFVVSLLNTVIGIEGKIGGHAVIVVEGYSYKEAGQLFVGQYDIKVAATSELGFLGNIAANMGLINVHGVITKVDIHENNKYENTEHFSAEQKYSSASSVSWYVKKANVELMIKGIKSDKEKINPEKGEYLPYQRFGSFTAFNNNDGHSCVTWCMEKLNLAGISFEQKAKYSIKSPPEKVVRSHTLNTF